MSDNPPDELPPPTRAGDDPGSNTGADAGSDATGATLPAGRPGPKRNRRFLILGGLAVVVVIAVAIVIFIATKGDGTKATANPLEVRQLVATFNCTSNNPGAPSDVKVTAGQEVVRVGRGGCAVVGPVIAKVDRATKVESKNTDGGCTMTFDLDLQVRGDRRQGERRHQRLRAGAGRRRLRARAAGPALPAG